MAPTNWRSACAAWPRRSAPSRHREFLDRRTRGHIFGFLGPNGSGKTTTIRMLCGLLTPDAGTGRCLGYDLIEESAAIKREVGYMPQRFGLYEDLSIGRTWTSSPASTACRKPDGRSSQRSSGSVSRSARVQLAGQLSGGWKQRLALAACLLHAPRLLLLDEPTAGVDPKPRREFWDRSTISPPTA